MNETEAIKYVKDLGMLEFSLISDNSVHYKTLEPVIIEGNLYDINVVFYIKEDSIPTIFKFDSIDNMSSRDLQLAEIIKVNVGVMEDELYFSKYKQTIKNK